MTHKEKAIKLLEEKYHCTQALFGAFAADLGLDLKTAFKISTCFGGGMRCGNTCGCITAGLLVLGMTFGFYNASDREQEAYGNKKTEEFIRRFTEKMNGMVNCRDILGKDISIPDEMAEIRKEGLILQKCPAAIAASIEILEDMTAEYITYSAESSVNYEDLPENDDLQTMVKRMGRSNKFRRNVLALLGSAEKVAFIQFDIRRFKIINDLYGEQFGDEVLEHISHTLGSYCNENQYFLNLRSDVFMVVTECPDDDYPRRFIDGLEELMSVYKNVTLRFSYGVYLTEDKTMELRRLEDRAAMARRTAKAGAFSNIVFYKEQFKDSLYNIKFIEENLWKAIEEHQFLMYLQPKYSISKNKIIGAEALVRWRNPERGMIFPDQFIPVIEENGSIVQVDHYIWSRACMFIRRCIDAGIEPCPVSVNVSRVHLRGDECPQILSDMVRLSGIPGELLELEITETADDLQISRQTERLKESGFKLLMDDFGSGYSSLNVLLETPFDVIKLDKRFMENMMTSDKGKNILENVLQMASNLDITVLAEGVETKEQVDLLTKIGCDQVQGYYYAKPMPEEEFFELYVKSNSK
ncbi:MAG: EAL domain-containing protein [Ruminococcaceae bacterium]|nr:EAL domain-containing protein [Oscillospiraceae bacterium]